MTKRQEPIARLIDRSSLGSPPVRKLRARTTTQQRNHIVRKASARTARESEGRATKSKRK